MIEGLEEIAKVTKALPDAINECKVAVKDLEHIYAAIKNMSNIWSFAYHVGKDLIVNRVQIFDEISLFLEAYHK